MLFFGPVVTGAAATSASVSCVFSPLRTLLYGFCGAIQGIMGAYALSLFGYSCGSFLFAAAIGAAAGAAIAAPIAIALGLKSILESEGQPSIGGVLANFVLNVGIMFLASLVFSSSLLLGIGPALAVATGAAMTEVVLEAVKFGINRV